MTDSSTGGFVVPTSPDALNGLALVRAVDRTVAGITGLTGPDLVRPRWQPKPLPQPDRTVNWVSVGITSEKRETNSSRTFDPCRGLVVAVPVESRLIASFYGPDSSTYAARLALGFTVGQNREAMRALGLAFVSVGEPTHVPELDGEEYVDRVDLTFTLRRLDVAVYPVASLLSGSVDVVGEAVTRDGIAAWHNPTQIGP